MCQLVKRSLQKAGTLHEACGGNVGAQESGNDWREMANQKAKDTIDFQSNPETPEQLATAVVVTEPLEHLSAVLQSADVQGHAVDELVGQDRAVHKCEQHLFLLLQPPDHPKHNDRTLWPCDMLCHHFGFSDKLADNMTHTVVSIASQVWSRLHCLSEVWDFRILMLGSRSGDGPLVEQEMDLLISLLAEDECCLGPWFTEWLQKLGGTYLQGPEMRLLFSELRRKLKATNMGIERLLKEIKESFPSFNSGPAFAETTSIMASLQQLWQRHVASGGNNPFMTSRADLLSEGLPVAKFRRKSGSELVNPQVAAINRIHNQMKKQDVAATRRAAAEAFQDMPRAEQDLLLEDVQRQRRPVESPDLAPQPVPAHRSKWSPSDGEWPVSSDVILKSAGDSGLASFGERVRKESRAHLLSKGKGLLPGGHVFLCRCACVERHPGLCYTKDEPIYKNALKLAKNIEAFCRNDMTGKFVLCCSGDDKVSMPLYVAERRSRRSFAPQALVFAHCILLPSLDLGWDRIEFSEGNGARFDFTSVWSVAKTSLLAAVDRLFFKVGERRWVVHDSGCFSQSELLIRWPEDCGVQLWPGRYRPPKKDMTQLSDLMRNEAPAKPKGPRSARIKSFVGVAPRTIKTKPTKAEDCVKSDNEESSASSMSSDDDTDAQEPHEPTEVHPPPEHERQGLEKMNAKALIHLLMCSVNAKALIHRTPPPLQHPVQLVTTSICKCLAGR